MKKKIAVFAASAAALTFAALVGCGAPEHVHAYSDDVIGPTCTEQGYTLHKCDCGDEYKDTYTAALGHSYADGACSRCGASDTSSEAAGVKIDGDIWASILASDLTNFTVETNFGAEDDYPDPVPLGKICIDGNNRFYLIRGMGDYFNVAFGQKDGEDIYTYLCGNTPWGTYPEYTGSVDLSDADKKREYYGRVAAYMDSLDYDSFNYTKTKTDTSAGTNSVLTVSDLGECYAFIISGVGCGSMTFQDLTYDETKKCYGYSYNASVQLEFYISRKGATYYISEIKETITSQTEGGTEVFYGVLRVSNVGTTSVAAMPTHYTDNTQ